MNYVVGFCKKQKNIYYSDYNNSIKFSLELETAKQFKKYNDAKKCSKYLTKKYNLDFNVFKV